MINTPGFPDFRGTPTVVRVGDPVPGPGNKLLIGIALPTLVMIKLEKMNIPLLIRKKCLLTQIKIQDFTEIQYKNGRTSKTDYVVTNIAVQLLRINPAETTSNRI